MTWGTKISLMVSAFFSVILLACCYGAFFYDNGESETMEERCRRHNAEVITHPSGRMRCERPDGKVLWVW